MLGAALSLGELEEANPFPLLTKAAREVADRTARNQITLGGNICGQIFYRETALPLFVAEADVIIAGPYGIRQCRFLDLFHQQLQLGRGDLSSSSRLTVPPPPCPISTASAASKGKSATRL